jgi:hypothetical protein
MDYRKLIAALLACRPGELHMQSVFIPSHRIVYISNAKVAGTTIVTTLLKAECSPFLHRHNTAEARKAISSERDPAAFWRAVNDADTFKFAFVRNPYTRVLSGYLDKVLRDRQIRAELGYNDGDQVTFGDFLRNIANRDLHGLNRHFRPQSLLISPKLQLDLLGRLETFDRDFQVVLDRLGAPAYEDDRTHRTDAARHLTLIGSEEKRLIDEIYNEDFRRFGYETETRRL